MRLAEWIDLFSRRVVGWKLDHRMDAALVVEALNRAPDLRRVEPEALLLHTDQGSPVPGYRLPGSAGEARECLQHVRQGLLLGQRRGGEFFLHPVAEGFREAVTRTRPG
ncbi:DDE-type integrase/transposase/recombinase [Cyanobium sp. NS01]|uniref:DDE-type integrase/transposase/recombinase n=1 Tax=Cyanobium sp. NS01 TaxID=261284 RepID=UPI001CECFACB